MTIFLTILENLTAIFSKVKLITLPFLQKQLPKLTIELPKIFDFKERQDIYVKLSAFELNNIEKTSLTAT